MIPNFQIIVKLVVAGSLLAGCAQGLRVTQMGDPTVDPKPSVTAHKPTEKPVGVKPVQAAAPTETPTPAATATEIPTPTATVEAAETHLTEWDKAEINMNGNQVEFVVGMEDNSDVLSMWSKWGVEGLAINKGMKGSYDEKFGKMIGSALWQASTNGGSVKPIEEFLQNSDQYPIVFVEPDGKGGFRDKSFKLNDIKKIEWRFVNSNDPKLYFLNPQIAPRVGYKMKDDGTFIIYTAPTGTGLMDDIKNESDFKKFSKEDLSYIQGLSLGNIVWEILEMSYTGTLYDGNPSEGDSPKSFDVGFTDKLSNVWKGAGFINLWDGNTLAQLVDYYKKNGYLKAVVK